MKNEIKLFEDFLVQKELKYTSRREIILEIFLKTERHMSPDELYDLVKKKDSGIGFATVYRTLKLIKEAGLGREVDFGDGKKRFEHCFEHKHHDHLICIKCGKALEVADDRIEKLQEALVKRHKFNPVHHRLEIFGYCKDCDKKPPRQGGGQGG